MPEQTLPCFPEVKNYVFVGEAGCGKSELAINLAFRLKAQGKAVHFFDLDQTKPLFRSRDVKDELADAGIEFHYVEQFQDEPVITGGVREQLAGPDSCVLDVGGDDIGSRAVGGFANLINQPQTVVYFVLNPFRPWSRTLEAIDGTLSAILEISHIEKFHIICNPNFGFQTTAEEALEGIRQAEEHLEGRVAMDFVAAREDIAAEVAANTTYSVFPMHLYLTYPWDRT